MPALAQGVPGIPDAVEAETEVVSEELEVAATPVPPPAATAQLSEEDAIIVRGLRERMSSWKRLTTDQIDLYSNGSESDMKKVALKIERLDALLTQLFGAKEPEFERQPLTVTLIGGRNFVDRMRLDTPSIQDSGFGDPFANERYYSPTVYRTLLAAGRRDQEIDTSTLDDFLDDLNQDSGFGDPFEAGFDNGLGSDLGDDLSFGDDGFFDDPESSPSNGISGGFSSPRSIGIPRDAQRRRHEDFEVDRKWEAVLYGYYTEHFLLSNFATSYPRWYIDGLVAMFSTFDLRRDGKAEYWRAPPGLHQVLRSYPPLKTEPILTGEHLLAPDKSTWSPYHAWLLTHFFLVGNPEGPRREQFMQYMAAVGQGDPLPEAAKVFGDFEQLNKEVAKYRTGKILYTIANIVEPEPDLFLEPSTLGESDAEALQAMVLLEPRVETPLGNDKDREKLAALREVYLVELRNLAAANLANTDVSHLLAEAECRAGNYDNCLRVADRVLAEQPEEFQALKWRAVALLHLAGRGDADAVTAARQAIIKANRADTEGILPLVAFFRSHEQAGEPMPELAMLGLIKVVAVAPAATEPRLLLGRELVRRGEKELAREILLPVLNAKLASAERSEAERLLAATKS